jgi:hypothetical protein
VSSAPPPGQHDFDEADTGPLHLRKQDTWASRFDAPLTISPRPVHTTPNRTVLWGAVAAVVAVAAVGGLVVWLVQRSSSDSPEPSGAEAEPTMPVSPPSPRHEDEAKLLQLLPAGYQSDSCEPIAPPKDAVAQVNCGNNADPGGPASGTYTLARDKATLERVFNESIRSANRVNCPGNIQSPGPWRRNASPDKVSGTLFCGLREGQPTVIWTDDTQLLVSAVQSGPQGPPFPPLYDWWSSHS